MDSRIYVSRAEHQWFAIKPSQNMQISFLLAHKLWDLACISLISSDFENLIRIYEIINPKTRNGHENVHMAGPCACNELSISYRKLT